MKLDSTPGPWVLGSYGGCVSNGDHSVPCSSGFIEEAYCGNDATPESRANDRLIAAAPEMLEQLINIEKRYSINFSTIEKIIEKATGKTWEELNAQ